MNRRSTKQPLQGERWANENRKGGQKKTAGQSQSRKQKLCVETEEDVEGGME